MRLGFRAPRWQQLRANPQRLLVFVLLGVLIYLVVGPLLFLVFGSLTRTIGKPEISLSHIVRAYNDPKLLTILGNTFIFTLGATLLSVFLGGMAAWITERLRTPLQQLTRITTIVSLIVSSLFIAIAWCLMLSPKAGIINVWLQDIFNLTKGPIDIYSLAGMIWVEGTNDAPFAYLLIMAAMRLMDPSLEEAAMVSGASVFGTLRRITIPLSLPAILSVVLFRMVRGFEAFEIPSIIGSPRGIEVLTSKIYMEIELFRSYSTANAYGLGLVALVIVGLYLYQRMLRRSYRFVTIAGRGARLTKKIDLGHWCWLPTSFLAAYILVVGILPTGSLLWYAITPYPMQPSVEALSFVNLQNFPAALRLPYALTAIRNTLLLAVGGAFICVLLASIVSWVVVRTNLPGRQLVDNLSFLPVTIPGIVMGIALLWIYLSLPIPIYGTLWILLIGYVTVSLPVAVRFTTPGMTQIHKELEECAYIHGASWWTTFRRILIPLAIPSTIAAGLYVFLLITRVVSMAVVVYTPDSIVLPVLIFRHWGEKPGNVVVALALIMIVVLLPIGIVYYWFINRYGLSRSGQQ